MTKHFGMRIQYRSVFGRMSWLSKNMIPDIRYTISQCNVEIRPDLDGEERVFCVECVLDLDIRLYEKKI